jgi:serine/threonine protein kinase
MATRGDAYRDERGQNGGAAAAQRDSAGPPTGATVSAYAVRIADRYHLEDRISESGQSALWRAFDDTLGRPVTVRTFGPGVADAAKVVAAARAACRVPDERLARVFDAHVAGDGAYIVTEWLGGENLEDLLMLGQLDVGGATRIVAEAAGALAAAHAAGIAHLHLTLRSVLWSRDAGVKIIGLGIDAALAEAGLSGTGLSGTGLSGTGLPGTGLSGTGLSGTGLADAEPMEAARQAALPAKISTAARADTRALARILYAGLTGYWPGPQDSVLPAAPRRDGRPYRPRQVRAGVPARIDEITCRALFEPQPRDPPPVTSPGEFAELLRGALRHEQSHSAQTAALSPVTFVDGAVGADGAGGGGGADGFQTARIGQPPRSRRRARTLAAGGVLGALFVIDSALIGMNIMGASHPTHVARQAAHTQRPAIVRSHQRPSRLLKPVSAQAFDPYGNGSDENSQLAPAAIDNDPSTAWHTFWYTTAHFGNLEAGTGLVVDMGGSVTVTSVQVLLGPVPGANVQLRIGDSTDSLDAMGVAATADNVGGQVSMRPTAPYHGRYVLIWFTKLPPASDGGGVFQADVFNVAVHGF